MFFIDLKKHQSENMKNFERLPEFQKEFSRLLRKYPSLTDDIKKFEKLIVLYPTGVGVNFVIMHHGTRVKVVKARLACKSLRDRSIRIIYAYHSDAMVFMHIEIYFKGDKENEDRARIEEYLKDF